MEMGLKIKKYDNLIEEMSILVNQYKINTFDFLDELF